MLRIYLFGQPEVILDEKPLTIVRKKSRALLYYLAAQRATVPRTRLQTIFWPDASQSSAQQLLRTSLYGLRQELGDALFSERDQIGLALDCWVDTRIFEEMVNPGEPELEKLVEGVSLYRAEFLADFFLPDSNSFEDWANTERERYRRLAIRGFSRLGRLLEDAEDYTTALDSFDKALEIDPLQEDLQREAIRLAYLKGDRPDAIQRYDSLRRMLDEELGVPPMLETRSLYDSILSDTLKEVGQAKKKPRTVPTEASRGRASADVLPFIGRSEELRLINELVNSRKLAFIEGEPGIGKTRLVEEYLQSTGSLLLQATAHEMEQHLPYQPIIDAFRNLVRQPGWSEVSADLEILPVWRREAARLFPEVDPGAAV
ncbi:MAG: transcriptional regulator, partial [Chloroflexi bacterium]